MIIDDEQMILDMLRDQFEMEQYQVITAKSGEEALRNLACKTRWTRFIPTMVSPWKFRSP